MERCAVIGGDLLPLVPYSQETIRVEFEVSNPLQVLVDISEMCLDISHTDGAAEAFTTIPFNFSLSPSQRRIVALEAIALLPGGMSVNGVRWTLSSTVPSAHVFRLKGRRLNRSHEEKVGCFYEPDKRLELTVVPQMPLLRVDVSGAPPVLMHGELVKLTLELTNIGSEPVRSCSMNPSLPHCAMVGTPQQLDDPFPCFALCIVADGSSHSYATALHCRR